MARTSLLCALILSACLLARCIHTHRVTYAAVASYASINARAEREIPHLQFIDGTEAIALGLHPTPESVRWYDREAGHIHVVPTTAIQRIVFSSRGKGAAEGFLVGAVLGGTLGLLVGHDETGDGWIGPQAFAIAFGIPGRLLGTLIGTAASRRDMYYLDRTPDVPGAGEEE